MPAGVLVGIGGRMRQQTGQLGIAPAGGHFQILRVFHLFHAFQIMSEALMKRSANAAQSCRKRDGRAA